MQNLWKNTDYFRKALKDAGFNTGVSETPIIPVMVGQAKDAFEFSRRLFDQRLLVTGNWLPDGTRRPGAAAYNCDRHPYD